MRGYLEFELRDIREAMSVIDMYKSLHLCDLKGKHIGTLYDR